MFFYDLLIPSPDLKTHFEKIREVISHISSAGLRINLDKSDWVKSEVKFLGHMITSDGVKVPDDFTKIIKEWPLPETLKQLKSFTGKCNYYRSHFKDFAKIAAPLMEHLKGSTESSRKLNLNSDPKAIESFNTLKELLTSPQLLAYPDFNSNKPFILDTDYSNDGIGAVLSQEQNGVERPIAFNARKLKPSKSQYASHQGELLALTFGIHMHKFFLTG